MRRQDPIEDLFIPRTTSNSQHRAAKILDSLVTILVGQSRGGVFAVGARVIHDIDPSN